ncbi:BatD family protein, partial [Escherichia coli]|nr:BatD family protein [Escherichia coli]
ELALQPADGLQVFGERPTSDESMVDGRPRVRLQRRFSVVPSRAGTLVLPGPRIDWWDTQAGVARTAKLPAITLQVAPGAVATTPDDEA